MLGEQTERAMQVLASAIKNAYSQVKQGTVIHGINFESDEEFTYSQEELHRACGRFRNGKYYKQAEVERLLEDVKMGNILCMDVPEEMRGFLDFDEETWTKIRTEYSENLVYLIECMDRIDEQVYYYMNEMTSIPNNVLGALSQKNELDIFAIMNFFEQGKITADQISTTGLSRYISQDMINIRIRELYSSIQNSEIGEEEKAKNLALFNKYSGLYRKLYIEEKTEKEIAESGFSLVSSFADELNENALQDLYQYNLITLDVAADWGADLTKMLEQGQIKATDLKKLYADNIVTIEQIRSIIKFGTISNDEKQDLIYATFDGDTKEEEEIRATLIQLLAIGEEYRGEPRQTATRREGTSSEKWKNYVSDPQTRWKFISLLDKDYSKRILPQEKQVLDGHRVFLLPNQDAIIIEKMYEKRRGKMVSAYGSATYLVPTTVFYDHLDDIIKNEAINRSFLYEMSELEMATPIMHSKNWGRNIMKYFGIDADNERYTIEEFKEILKAADRVSQSRRERE